jgi:hypothetical protein
MIKKCYTQEIISRNHYFYLHNLFNNELRREKVAQEGCVYGFIENNSFDMDHIS